MLLLNDVLLVDFDQYISKDRRSLDMFWSAFWIEGPMLSSL